MEAMLNGSIKQRLGAVTQLLKECARLKDLRKTHTCHFYIIEAGFEASQSLRSALISAYSKCGSLNNSWTVFNQFLDRDVVLWTSMITGYAQNGHGDSSLILFNQMQVEGVFPNEFTFSTIVRACSNIKNLRLLHCNLTQDDFDSDVKVGNVLIDIYSKLGYIDQAWLVFNRMQKKDIVSWSAIMSACCLHSRWKESFMLFIEMHQKQVNLNNYAYVTILKACASLNDLGEIKFVHSEIVEGSLEDDIYVRSALIDTYVKCGSLEDAKELFERVEGHDLVCTNAMICGYTQNLHCHEALVIFRETQNKGVLPDKVTFGSMLKSCGSLISLQKGKELHACIKQQTAEYDPFMASALIDMYVKWKRLEDANSVFNEVTERGVTLWNCLLAGYVDDEHDANAITLFGQMWHEGVHADVVTYVIVLKSCTSLEYGKQVHVQLIINQYDTNMIIRSSLIDMYTKCGSIGDARRIFDNTRERDTVLWNSMITAYTRQGLCKEALALFKVMEKEVNDPSVVTLSCVLSVFRHADHIDACKIHPDIDAADNDLRSIERLKPRRLGSDVLLSNIYAVAKRRISAEILRNSLMSEPIIEPCLPSVI